MDKTDLENDVDNGLSSYQITKKYSLGQTTVVYWMKKFGLKSKYHKPTFYDKLNWKQCQKLYDTGLSWKELVKMRFPHNGIEWAVKNKKLKLRPANETNKITHLLGKVDYSVYRTPEFRKKMSAYGGFREKASGRAKGSYYIKKDGNKTWLQGSWEIKFATFLDGKNIKWERNKLGYRYIFEGKEHSYFPDFVLTDTDTDTYVEVKGYQKPKDEAKWSQFPKKLLIVKKKEIQDLESWWKTIQFTWLPSITSDAPGSYPGEFGAVPKGATNFGSVG